MVLSEEKWVLLQLNPLLTSYLPLIVGKQKNFQLLYFMIYYQIWMHNPKVMQPKINYSKEIMRSSKFIKTKVSKPSLD